MKRLCAILLCVLALAGANAQDDVAFTNYWNMPAIYNPAAAGVGRLLDVNGAFRMEMAGFENSGQEFLIQADMPLFFLSARHGVGVGFMNDKIGLFSNKRLWLDYAYHHPLGKKNRMSVGLRLAFMSDAFSGSSVITEQSGDDYLPTTDMNGSGFDLDLGLRFDHGSAWHVGAACAHILSPGVNLGDEKKYQIRFDPTLYVLGGCEYKFRNPVFTFMGDAVVRSNFQSWRADVTARVGYDGPKVRMYGGLNYSPMVSVAMLLGFTFHGAEIGYSYEMYTGGIGIQNGTHEITIGYRMDLNIARKGRNYHQSVRWL